MNRLLALVAVGLVAGVAVADVAPPKGQKRVPLDYTITTEKELGDYQFFTVVGNTVKAVKFDPKTPIEIPGAGRGGIGRLGRVVAVPKDAAKKYGDEKELHKAVADRKIDGQLQTSTNLDSFTVVKDSDKRDVIVIAYTVEKLDAKAGIVLKAKAAEAKKDGKDSPEEDDSDAPAAYAPRGHLLVAGIAAALAVTLGGLWAVGRARRKG